MTSWDGGPSKTIVPPSFPAPGPTAFLGGATAAHVRLGQPSFLFAIVMGVLVWTGLCLREDRLRDLVIGG